MENERFASKDEEITCLRKRLQDCQIELEEYQESSRELEAELEAQLTASEKRNTELKNYNIRLQTENENLKSKLAMLNMQSSEQIFDLQKQLNEIQVNNAKLTRCIRELEQSNDDLERAKRALHASLEDFEKKLNQQIEKNVLLENELGEKEQLEEIIQRLKDEARDLKQELLVQQQQPSLSYQNEDNNEQIKCLPIRSNTLYYNENKKIQNSSCNGKMIDDCSKLSTNNTSDLPNCSLLSPSTRVSVLNIVSDLLRKAGALESKLASCKTISNNTTASSSPIKNGLNCQNGHFN